LKRLKQFPGNLLYVTSIAKRRKQSPWNYGMFISEAISCGL
jgi:hypothetical protein